MNSNDSFNQFDSPNFLPSQKEDSAETNHLEAELRLTLEEIARLQNSLAEANMKILALQNNAQEGASPLENSDPISPIIVDFTQHLHTIRGYLDLLLNESVGMLGTFQKRFLDRIATSVDQMQDLLNNMNQLAEERVENVDQFSQEFSLADSISETISLFTEQIRSKEITLKVDLTSSNSIVYADRESFERILNILFANACSSVQPQGSIQIGLHALQGKSPSQFLLNIQTYSVENEKRKPQVINLDEFKNQEIILPGFALPLKDIIIARNLTASLHGILEIFSIPEQNSLVRLRLPQLQRNTLS